jgi:hypothetical protein
LTFEGCPNADVAVELVRSVARETGIDVDVQVVDVPDAAAAQRMRFLGSPTIRVDGHDIEPGADGRTDYVHSCRVFPTEHGLRGQPDASWVRDALARAADRDAG